MQKHLKRALLYHLSYAPILYPIYHIRKYLMGICSFLVSCSPRLGVSCFKLQRARKAFNGSQFMRVVRSPRSPPSTLREPYSF